MNKRKVKGNIGHDMEGNWYLYSDSIINKFENYKEKLLGYGQYDATSEYFPESVDRYQEMIEILAN